MLSKSVCKHFIKVEVIMSHNSKWMDESVSCRSEWIMNNSNVTSWPSCHQRHWKWTIFPQWFFSLTTGQRVDQYSVLLCSILWCDLLGFLNCCLQVYLRINIFMRVCWNKIQNALLCVCQRIILNVITFIWRQIIEAEQCTKITQHPHLPCFFRQTNDENVSWFPRNKNLLLSK